MNGATTATEATGARPTLVEAAAAFRDRSAGAVPGRLAALLADRVARLHGDPDAPLPPADLTDAERVVLDVAEQFVVDVHGLTDPAFARLRDHLGDDEIVAIMFHLACLDGFGKLDSVAAPARADRSDESAEGDRPVAREDLR